MNRFFQRLVALTLTLLAMVNISCVRQELEEPYQYLAYFPISTDWEDSLIDEEDISHVSIYFYPLDGGEPLTYLSADIYFNLVQVPVGEYSVLIFNDLADNVKGVDFDNINSYANHSVNITNDATSQTLYYDKPDSESLATEHNRIAAWSLDEVIVDETMVEYTRSDEFAVYIENVRSKSKSKSSKTDDDGSSIDSRSDDTLTLPDSKSEITKSATKAIEELSQVSMQPETTILNVRVRVENLNNAMYFKAVVKGTASGTYLSSDGVVPPDGTTTIYYLDVASREYDDPADPTDGYVNFTLNTFGRLTEGEQYDISFRVVQMSGTSKEFERDITDQVVSDDDHQIDIELTDQESTLVLDLSDAAGFEVSGWGDDVVVYL